MSFSLVVTSHHRWNEDARFELVGSPTVLGLGRKRPKRLWSQLRKADKIDHPSRPDMLSDRFLRTVSGWRW